MYRIAPTTINIIIARIASPLSANNSTITERSQLCDTGPEKTEGDNIELKVIKKGTIKRADRVALNK